MLNGIPVFIFSFSLHCHNMVQITIEYNANILIDPYYRFKYLEVLLIKIVIYSRELTTLSVRRSRVHESRSRCF